MTTAQEKDEVAIAAIVSLLLRRAQRLLRAAFRSIVMPIAGRAIFQQDVTNAVVQATKQSVLAIRRGARSAAVEAWKKSSQHPHVGVDLEAIAHDEDRAARAAVSIGEQWDDISVDAETLAAMAALIVTRLDRTAETEAMEAYADETARQLDAAAQSGVVLLERWCARLDACPHCADMDGTIAVHPDVLPIPAHPRCRCFPRVEIATSFEAVA